MSFRHGTTFLSRRPEAQKGVKKALRTAGDKIGLHLEGAAKRAVPVDDGRLRASLHHRVDEKKNSVHVDVGTNVKYAFYVHEGTGKYHPEGRKTPWVAPMTIKGRLVFRWTEGRKPSKFIETPARQNADRYRKRIRTELGKLQ